MSDFNIVKFTEYMDAAGIETHVIDDVPPTEVPSPFLPGTNVQYAWDATSLDYLKRCPRLYQYKMIDNYRSIHPNVHLRYGSEVHLSLRDFEACKLEGYDHDETVFHVVRELLQRTEDYDFDVKYKTRLHLLTAVIRYMDQFRNDPAETMVLATGKPALELKFAFELDWGPTSDQPYVLCGYLDRVVNYMGAPFVLDYKTTTSTPGDYYWNRFEPDNQMSLYTFASQVIFEIPVKGVMIRSGQVLVEDSRWTTGMTHRTKDQITEWVGDLRYWFALAKEFADRNYWPMNDTACDKYGGCEFREICSKSPGVRSKFLNGTHSQDQDRWNPLVER